jgi:hypothetical protein
MADMHLLCSEILDGILISNSCFRLMRKEGGIQIWVLLSGILVGGRLGRDGTKTILERVEMGPQGSRYVKVMDEWTQADIRRKGKRKKTAAKKRRRRRTQTRRSGETILV